MTRRIVTQSRIVGNLSDEELAMAEEARKTMLRHVRRVAGNTSAQGSQVVATYEEQEDGTVRRVLIVAGEQREALRSSWHGAAPEVNEHYKRQVAAKGISWSDQRAIDRAYHCDSFKV
jgi:hypothetical protein